MINRLEQQMGRHWVFQTSSWIAEMWEILMDPMIVVLVMKARVVVCNRFRENDIMDVAVRHELRRRCTILGAIRTPSSREGWTFIHS